MHDQWPRVDDLLVEPETRQEIVRGERIEAMPANPPHGDRHNELDYIIRGNVASGYVPSSDLLTRVGPNSNFATDVCVRRVGVDPATGARYLEELAFEQGREEGREEGRAEGLVDALLTLLAQVDLVPTDEQRAIISACRDDDRLRRWIRASIQVESVAELLALE